MHALYWQSNSDSNAKSYQTYLFTELLNRYLTPISEKNGKPALKPHNKLKKECAKCYESAFFLSNTRI